MPKQAHLLLIINPKAMTGHEFDTIFRRLYLPLGMYALRILGDAAATEDIVEDTFLKAWQTLESGKEIDNFTGYLYRSVRNGCLSFLRNKKDIVTLDNFTPDENSAPFTNIRELSDSDDDAMEQSMRDARIWKAIGDLPDRCREVFLLSKRDGLSNEEIAEELDISIKTVKNQMTKAFSRLREALSDNQKPFFLPFL